MSTTSNKPHPIRLARQSRRWSQSEVGAKLSPKVGKATVSMWENGITYPSREAALQLTKIFGGAVTLDSIYRYTPERQAA